MKFRKNSISFKQSINVVTAAFLIGIVIAFFQLYFEFQQTRQSFEATMKQVINISKQTAAQSAYSFDDASAHQVVVGLFEYLPIYAVKISENFGTILSEEKRKPMSGELDFLSDILIEKNAHLSIELIHDNQQLVGKMDVSYSNYSVLSTWYERSIRTLLSTVVQSILLAIILLILFNRGITQPLLFIVKSLGKIEIGKPSDIRLAMPENHQKDELGLLVNRTNQLLAAIKSDGEKIAEFAETTRKINQELENEINERRQAEKALREAQQFLEMRVEERTADLTKEIAIREKYEIELKAAKNAAESANKAKSSFIANMSHEIRTPLNAILGFSQILGRNKLLPKDVINTLNTIEKSGVHLLELINDVLDLSKIEAGAITIQNSDFDLNELVCGVSEIFSLRCNQLGLKWQLNNQFDSPISVNGDQGKIRQILLNLIGNAVKFTEQGEVSLTLTSLKEDHYQFSIRDTGPGINKEDQQSVFRAFNQSTAGIDKGGTGLGLAICSKFLLLMKSELHLESTNGEGCHFYFDLYLPVAKSKLVSSRSDRIDEIKLSKDASVKALVVDDVIENRILLSFLLEELNVSVIEAENGAEALEKISKNDFDIVFMDIRMPVMNGYEAVNKIHEIYAEDRPKCVAVSASVININANNFNEKGFDDFVAKPFRIERIYNCLQKHLPKKFTVSKNILPADTAMEDFDEKNIMLPLSLSEKIKKAAKLYQISLLNGYIEELANLSNDNKNLVTELSKLIHDYKMDQLIEKIEQYSGKLN